MRKYKSVGIDPSKVRVQNVMVLPPQSVGNGQLIQFITEDQHAQYAITLVTDDQRTFNRLLRRLS